MAALEEKIAIDKDIENVDPVNSVSNSDDCDYTHPDEKEWKRLRWKLDLRIVPYVGILYLCSFLDRVNIGNAKVAGITEDIDITPDEYNWALSIFFIGYIIFEIPSNMLLKRIGPRTWLSIVMVSWGVTMAAMAAVHNGAGLLASRFFLGITEAGLFPGVIYYLTLWYTRAEQASRLAFFFGCSTVAGAFGGVLAYGIMQMEGLRGLHGWQWIFIIEALPTILFAFTTYFVLPDFPESKSKFLNERERQIIVHRLKADAGPATETEFSWVEFRAAVFDWKVYLHAAIYICTSIPLYSLSLFLPSIVQGMGFTNLRAQAMTAPPYAIACIATILVALHADRHKERGLHIAGPALLGAIGYILLITLKDKGSAALYVAACITTTGVFSCIPAMLSYFSSNLGGHTKRGVGIAINVMIGNIGGAIGGQIYRNDDAPYYTRGHETCLGLMCGAVVLSILFKLYYIRENKRRDNLSPEEYQKACQGTHLCDKHPGFRYIS